MKQATVPPGARRARHRQRCPGRRRRLDSFWVGVRGAEARAMPAPGALHSPPPGYRRPHYV